MTEIFAIVECKVTYIDGSIEIRRPTFTEVSVDLASVDKVSVVNYLRQAYDILSNENKRKQTIFRR